ncbi:caspase-7-like [Uranotaenia lowii]|uniref:caspase-7-like n=1 Tax=Uranotaenia lowii TaxID=190385 RepID=UPI00247AADF7|nr:caspase-7-like [Uranotaenia lowii]
MEEWSSKGSQSDASDAQGYLDLPSTSTNRRNVFLSVPVAPDSRFYAMNGEKRGKVLIFNQMGFDDWRNYTYRFGSEQDVAKLYDTLPNLGFLEEDIFSYHDLTAEQIQGTARRLAVDPTLIDCDCLITVILTHGENDDLVMAKDTSYHLYEFIENFTPSALPSMAGKPKLFIVNACRGELLDDGSSFLHFRSRTDLLDTRGNVEIFSYPEFADFLIVMSSHHGHFSFRNEQGSWLIQEFCNVLNNCRVEQDSIYDILTETNLAVSTRIADSNDSALVGKKQISSFYSTLTRRLYFARR